MSAQLAPTTPLTAIEVDREGVLRHLGLDPRKPEVQALVLTCKQYELDPVLKHMVLIKDQPYVTHKGLWHIAHRSGLLDGHEVVETGETSSEWWATVAIWRKDMSKPFRMTGRYPKSSMNKQYGPEMAVTRAECLVLRRMFDVSAPVQEEQDFEVPAPSAPPAPRAPEPAALAVVRTPGQVLASRLPDVKGTPTADRIRAAANGRKLTAAAFDADSAWADEVAAILDGLDPATGEILVDPEAEMERPF